MIEFTSLFLGFVVGLRPVELAVDARVAAVEIRLDGREVTRLEAPPWSVNVDFGPALEPHRLEALALDGAGRTLETVRRLVNYARADYEAAIVLEPQALEGQRPGRVIWAAVLDQDPVRLDLDYDGRSWPVAGDGRFVLPPHDPEESHFLAADLVFGDGHSVRAELSFGGKFGDRVTSALSAIPITSPPARAWSSDEVRGWLEHEGRPLSVFAARAEDGLLLVVRDQRAAKALNRLLRQVGDFQGVDELAAKQRPFDVTVVSTRPLKAHADTFELIRAGRVSDRPTLARLLLDARPRFSGKKRRREQQLWDAVALAGRHASASNRPRAVILMVAGAIEDRSQLRAEQTLHFLDRVRVPLFVWGPEEGSVAQWRVEDRSFHGLAALVQLVDRVMNELAGQTVIWLEGEYLPAEVTLGDSAPPGVAIVR